MNNHLKKYLDSWTESDTPTDQPKQDPTLPKPWPLEERLCAAELVELIVRYQAGATSRELADELGVGKTAIVRLLRENGVSIRPRGAKPQT